jgi:hypothetical protein
MTHLVGIDRPKPLLEKPPVDRPAELRQRVIHVDNLVKPRLEETGLSALPPLLGPHRIILRQIGGGRESPLSAPFNLQGNKPTAAAFLQMQ